MDRHITTLGQQSTLIKRIGAMIFYFSLIMVLISNCLTSTLIESETLKKIAVALLYLGLIGALVSFLLGKMSHTQLIFSLVLLSICSLSYYYCGDTVILLLGIFICGAINANAATIMRVFLFTLSISTLIVAISAKLGVIPTRLMDRTMENGILSRNSLGFNHPNTLAANIFIITIAFIFLNYKNFKFYNYIVAVAAFIFCYTICNSRTYAFALLFMLLFIIFDQVYSSQVGKNILSIGCSVIILILSFYLPLQYGKSSNFYSIDALLSGRLSFGNTFLMNYKIPFFGQHIDYVSTELSAVTGIPSLILDNSYLHILYSFGLITFIIFIFCIYLIYKRMINNYFSNNFAIIAFTTILFCAFFETIAYRIYFNPLLLFIFCSAATSQDKYSPIC